MLSKLRCAGAGFIVGLLVAGIIVGGAYWRGLTHKQPSVEATDAPEVRDRKTATIETAPLRYFKGAKEPLTLAPSVKANPLAVVTAATKIGISDYPHTVTAVTDTGTGVTSLFVREDPLPWMQSRRALEVGLNYGVNEDAKTGYRLDLRYDVLQIKAANFGVVGSIQDGRSFVGVGVRARW